MILTIFFGLVISLLLVMRFGRYEMDDKYFDWFHQVQKLAVTMELTWEQRELIDEIEFHKYYRKKFSPEQALIAYKNNFYR